MTGAWKEHQQHCEYGHAFPASRYNDPRGGRPSAIERNILRYRAVEASLYLFYADEVRNFMVTNLCPPEVNLRKANPWISVEENRLERLFSKILLDAQSGNNLAADDAQLLRLAVSKNRDQGKKLRAAFAHSIKIGMLTEKEASQVQTLLMYRNEIAHRIHLIVADVTRSQLAVDYISFKAPSYKSGALGELRAYRESLSERAQSCLVSLSASMNSVLFEFAENIYEAELKRLEKLIEAQIKKEHARIDAINLELDLRGTELIGDLSPRHPKNHRYRNYVGDDYLPPTGHLTKRGVEICYRLFDIGKRPIAVAYLMGIGLRAAERRYEGWLKAGGHQRVRTEIKRYPVSGPPEIQRVTD